MGVTLRRRRRGICVCMQRGRKACKLSHMARRRATDTKQWGQLCRPLQRQETRRPTLETRRG